MIEAFAPSLYCNLSQHTPIVLAVINVLMLVIWAQKPKEVKEFFVSYLVGLTFSAGVLISGMTRVSKILGFLTYNAQWDPSLIFVMALGVGINLVTFNLITKRSRPVLTPAFFIPPKGEIDGRLVLGATIFGLGWGISGTCVGPALALSCLTENGLFSLGSIVLGMIMYELTQGDLKLKGS